MADAARRAVSGVPPASPRRTASDAGAAPLEPRPCILDDVLIDWSLMLLKLAALTAPLVADLVTVSLSEGTLQ